jgi:hypothetical protein
MAIVILKNLASEDILYSRANWLSIFALIFVAENAVSDYFFSASLKRSALMLLTVVAFLFAIKHVKKNEKWFMLSTALVFFIALLAFFLRSVGVYDFSLYSMLRDLYHLFSCSSFLLLFLIMIRLRQNVSSIDRVFKKRAIFIALLLPLFSFLLFSIKPLVAYTFADNQGHTIQLTYLSLTSSIYRLQSIQFARMSGIFDEPGTMGMFFTFLSSILYLREGRLSVNGAVVLVAGLASVSLAYIIYVLCLLLYSAIHPGRRPARFRELIMQVVFTAMFFAALIGAASSGESEFGSYVVSRIESVFENSNNRSSGNTEAISIIAAGPAGISESAFESRELSSSGVVVLGAYKGILYAIAFFILYSSFVIHVVARESRSGWVAIPFIIAILIGFLTRNNLFNSSGPILLLVAFVVASVIYAESSSRSQPIVLWGQEKQ